jgi:aspartyl-tRNA(Asn)/glutamyl-tRNA(Gln) amidotransferase subunit A
MQTTHTDLAFCSANELNTLFRTFKASPVEALQAVEKRIDSLNPHLNAFCFRANEIALKQAKDSEARWLKNVPLSDLDGVPISIKDLILTKGMPTLRGSFTVDKNQAWDVDAPVTARLKEAGAVLLGKTSTPEFGCKAETNSPLTGITRNPWDLSKSPGGSSGGACAAVSANLGPIAIGTDGAGSIRIPAAFCGNFGFKPSFGRVPAYPLSPFGTVAHLGPHTMHVADAAATMNIIKKPDTRDWTSLPHDDENYLRNLNEGVKGLKIAFSPNLGYVQNVDFEVAAKVAQAAKIFESLGAQVELVDPGFQDPIDITTSLWFLGSFSIWSGLSKEQQSKCDPDFIAQAEMGKHLSALDIQNINLRRGMLGSHMRQFMSRYDLLLTPAVSIPAFDALPAGHQKMDASTMLGWTPFSYPFNLTQQPACSMPCGKTNSGLPVAFQLVGPMFADALVLQAARAFEEVMPISRPPKITI